MNIADYREPFQPAKVWRGLQILSNDSLVPKCSGPYAWYFQDLPAGIPKAGCLPFNDLTLLYVGIAPKRISSKQTLRDRIKNHLKGNAYGSTLRLSLGCLLGERLGLQLQRVGEKRMTFVHGEEKLSEWLANNAFVVWMARKEPWEVEAELIRTVSLPLNLEHNEQHSFYPILSARREAAKKKARELPIVRV